MANADLRMFMEDLKKIIHGNHHPLINNNPFILSERPQFQLLYQELDSIIQILSNIHQHHHHKPEKVRNLKKRFKDAAEGAQDTIDLFLSSLHLANIRVSLTSDDDPTTIFLNRFLSALLFRNSISTITTDVLKTSLDLKKVLKSIKSIKVELKKINKKMDSSSRIAHVKTQSVAGGTSYTRNPLGIKKPSEEIVVGLQHDAEIIRDKLTEDTKQLCVISIVGMGGQGKTTLATKLFNDPFLKYHFHIRAWATVSQTYIKRDLLIQILVSIGVQEDLKKANDSKLHEKLHKNLMGRRYLIVIDDIWSIEAWDKMKFRILLTTRLNEVALHMKPHGFVHSLPCLTEEESWEILKQKVFHGDECPQWLVEPGRQIARKCQGLPLSLVVMAGVLATTNKDLWENIACSVGSYMITNQKGCMETLALSYHHLPHHLRECFLYLGGFPEDFNFNVERLIWLWVAEGFIEEAENRTLEDTAKAYLMDLIDRNLVIVAKRTSMSDVKACKLHDLVRELCMQKAKEEEFFLKVDVPPLPSQRLEVMAPYTHRRVFTKRDITYFARSPTRHMRSLLYFKSFSSRFWGPKNFYSLALLRIYKLRYLAIWTLFDLLPSICKLISLQTLIVKMSFVNRVYLPDNISNLVNLRHLWSNMQFILRTTEKSTNLQSISSVRLGDGVDIYNIKRCFPDIKKLEYTLAADEKCLFELLPYLENLKLSLPVNQRTFLRFSSNGHPERLLNRIWFPASLKKLTLEGCGLPWSDMLVIQVLPNLEVLKLMDHAFRGRKWDASEQQFRQLKFLRLEKLNIRLWEANSASFPCLRRLALWHCFNFKGVPLEIGDISTLELIETDSSIGSAVTKSVKRILKEQRDEGNTLLKIFVKGMELSEHEDSESE
ncbi:LOW QUALITY PROTEIN: hypothetical protein OSB04_016136 [Centaurea solstitialis]|uniref:Uncharacterized protein n=1 Tax=Centaurea solstitialis TaxID=347529 RepID=A0AA38TDL9_9ASTR|nr:LOW QUALITY PROTEIN: hypothetical protein OSB04_016136 [Centaurea solstitialis]